MLKYASVLSSYSLERNTSVLLGLAADMKERITERTLKTSNYERTAAKEAD